MKAARRVSRTDADFERALLTSETVHLREGVDMTELGTMDVTSPPRRPSRTKATPATPTVVPPTPRSQHLQDGAFSLPPGASAYDADEIDLQTKRRSIFRSPGTASSPDLATLVRRARDRGGIVGDPGDDVTDDAQDGRTLFPPASEPASRQRTPSSVSSTYSLVSPPSPPPKTREDMSPQTPKSVRDQSTPNTPDWQTSSPRQRTLSKDGMKVRARCVLLVSRPSCSRPAQSMRATVKNKTSTFLGKMWGQGSVRDKPVRLRRRWNLFSRTSLTHRACGAAVQYCFGRQPRSAVVVQRASAHVVLHALARQRSPSSASLAKSLSICLQEHLRSVQLAGRLLCHRLTAKLGQAPSARPRTQSVFYRSE